LSIIFDRQIFKLIHPWSNMSYSADAREFATHLYYSLQEIPLYDVNGRRKHSKSFAESLIGLRSHGQTIDDWLRREEYPEEYSSSGSGGRREARVKITNDMAEDLIQCLHQDSTLTHSSRAVRDGGGGIWCASTSFHYIEMVESTGEAVAS
jgi:hypothetical protein